MKQHTLQPKLRFPEFKGEWKNYSFNDIFSFTTGKNIKQKEASPSFNIPCVRYGELYYMYKEVITKVINYTNLDESELKFSEGDEILLPSAGEDPMDIGSASALTLKDVAIGRTINVLKPKNKNIYSSIFASYYINQKLKIKISSLAKGVSISNVYNTDLQTLFIKLPSLPEQQKIADYLSTIDKKITLLEEKKTELSRYKKAMMQKLFSQEIRFKDENGNDFSDWEEKRLGDEIVVKVGATPSTLKKEFWNGDIPWINSSELKDGKISTPSKYITEIGFKNTSTYLLPKGTVVLAMTGATLGKLGILMLESTANQSVAGFVPNNNFLNEYLFYYLMHFQNKIFEKAGGAAQIGINKFNIESLKIDFPSLLEQQKIADFLSAIDESIDKVSEQIKETQSFKKAMLQQMFV